METSEKQLRETARRLLAEKKMDLLIGYEKGSLPGRSRPCVIRRPEEADRLICDATCSNNLAVYLPALFRKKPAPRGQTPPPPPKVGIVVKGCDALSVALLVRERQVPRAQLVLIGIPCPGIVDPAGAGAKPEILASCRDCAHPVAEGVDVRIEGKSREPATDADRKAADLDALSPDQRWEYFAREMSKCIRCYACRQACPNCYCPECFAEQTNPKWIGVSNDLSDTMLYHLGRILHQAGRCVGCDACVRACPMGVDLRTFMRKLAKDAKDLFDYEPDLSLEGRAMLSGFRETDRNDFITDPEKKTT